MANDLITAEPESETGVQACAGMGGSAHPTRRAAFAVAAGGCALALAGCSSYGDDAAAIVDEQGAAEPSDEPSPGETGSSANGGDGDSTKSIAAVSKIPVGGGLILKKQGVVLTQPTKGEIKAFSTSCTHAGCAVTKIDDGVIICPCHNSKFAIEDGAPTDGPASSPLESIEVNVKAKKVYLA